MNGCHPEGRGKWYRRHPHAADHEIFRPEFLLVPHINLETGLVQSFEFFGDIEGDTVVRRFQFLKILQGPLRAFYLGLNVGLEITGIQVRVRTQPPEVPGKPGTFGCTV